MHAVVGVEVRGSTLIFELPRMPRLVYTPKSVSEAAPFKRPSYTDSLRMRVRAARHPNLPTSRIADVLRDFAEPALAELATDADAAAIRSAYEVVISIWNAHVLAMPAWGAQPELARLAERVASGLLPTHMVDLFAMLSERRQVAPFDEDPRWIRSFDLHIDASGRVHLLCEANVPAALEG